MYMSKKMEARQEHMRKVAERFFQRMLPRQFEYLIIERRLLRNDRREYPWLDEDHLRALVTMKLCMDPPWVPYDPVLDGPDPNQRCKLVGSGLL
jgi:hypothetical protein